MAQAKTYTITADAMLASGGFLADEIEDFRREYPDGFQLTRYNLALLGNYLHLDTVAAALLSCDALRTYVVRLNDAQENYTDAVAARWRDYQAAVAEADAIYDAAVQPEKQLWIARDRDNPVPELDHTDWREARERSWTLYREAIQPHLDAMIAARSAAWADARRRHPLAEANPKLPMLADALGL